MTKRMIDYWVIPPENDAEFVACMEEVLETYEKPYDSSRPVICMDEQPVQLLKETRVAIEATKDHPKRVDYEYERNGTASIFMFTEPLSGFRQATAQFTTHQSRLGTGSRSAAGHPLRRLREGDDRVGQLEYSYQGRFLRSL